ncbi:hypothetical protein C7M84_005110 [Penaeus vannamei]|uniref:Uncharacterized protein n=1 Tax=Penaeus vannamei TaxID=6689 RepID=A0A423TIN0_PENVA|nr:hypothetical protein C7M84_005110 [Penaeus vannamei]
MMAASEPMQNDNDLRLHIGWCALALVLVAACSAFRRRTDAASSSASATDPTFSNKLEQQRAEKEEEQSEPVVVSQPQPGQEFASEAEASASATSPASQPSAQDSVVAGDGGEILYVSLDSAPEVAAPAITEEHLEQDVHAAQENGTDGFDSFLLTPDELLPVIGDLEPVTDYPDYDYVTEILEEVAATELPQEEVEGESTHVEHHTEFEQSEAGAENYTLSHDAFAEQFLPNIPQAEVPSEDFPAAAAKSIQEDEFLYDAEPATEPVPVEEPVPEEVEAPATEVVPGVEPEPAAEPSPVDEHLYHDQEAALEPEPVPESEPEPAAAEYEGVATEIPVETTDSPVFAEEPANETNIEILSTKNQQNPPVNDLYGKYFDESDLDFGKGANDNDKLLFPAETEQKVRSKIEIKEVNGQLYEYEYLYYYDDEYPLYDYEYSSPVDVEPADADAPATRTNSRSSSRESSRTSIRDNIRESSRDSTRESARDSNSRGSSRTSTRTSNRGSSRQQVADSQEANFIEPVRSSGRSRAIDSGSSSRSSSLRGRSSFRSREQDVNSIDNGVQSVTVEEDKLPAHTRFPPRTPVTTTPTVPEREPLFQESSRLGIDEHKQVPLVPEVTGLQSSHELQTSRGARVFDAEVPEVEAEVADTIYDEITTEEVPTTTFSPSALSLVNLYAFSRAADAEDMGEVTTEIPQSPDYETEIPIDYYYYDYESGAATDYPALTEAPSSTTTTTEAPAEESTQTRSRFGGSRFSSNRNRFSSNRFSTNRFKSQSSTDKPAEEEGEEAASEASVDSTTERSGGFRNRFNKPRVSSFRNRGVTKKDNEVTEPTTERTATRARPRLPSRAGLLGSRFRGRGTTAAAAATTEPTEDVEAPVEETVVADVEAEAESSTDTLESVISTTAAPAPARGNTRRRPSISRHRFGGRRKPEAEAKKEAEEVPAEGEAPAEEAAVEAEAPQAAQAPRLLRAVLLAPPAPALEALLLRARTNPRHRGGARTEAPAEEAAAPAEEAPVDPAQQQTDVQHTAEEVVAGEGAEQDPAAAAEEEAAADEPADKRRPGPKRAPSSNNRRTALTSLFNRRNRRPGRRNKGAAEEEPAAEEPVDAAEQEAPVEDDNQVAEAHLAAVEEQVVAEEPVVESEAPAEEAAEEGGPKRGRTRPGLSSLFNRRRRLNRRREEE